ncbi:hypothetical protein AUJ63_05115 [Candidatus Pacearchaeota archaeon CG1_02_35_32]|nr:MAG: hypothetical protein AUJ63_05115 [Candidatus Pacearchaeota archaeon CG1_02_35_32]
MERANIKKEVVDINNICCAKILKQDVKKYKIIYKGERMKVNREELLNAVTTVRPATSRIEDMANLYFSGEHIVAYNNSICCHAPFKSDFSFIVNTDLLYNFLLKISADEINMMLQEEKLLLKVKGTKATFTTILESDIVNRAEKIKEEIDSLEIKDLPEDFVEGAFLCMFSASRDPSLGTLTCLNIKGKQISCSDNKRVSIYLMKEEMEEIMIEASIASLLYKLKDTEITGYSVSDAWIHFHTSTNILLSVRRILGTYPDFSSFFVKFGGTKISLPEELKNSIEVASLIIDKEETSVNHRVSINLSKNKIECKASSSQGEITKSPEIEYDGKEVSFSINPTFLLQVLEKATTMYIKEGKAMFRAGSFRHIMMLPSS